MESTMSCEYVRRTYRVPAEIGRRVIVYGKPGVIAADLGHHIGVNFDEDPPGRILPAHPTSEVSYHDMGAVRKLPRHKQRAKDRYQRYLDCDGIFDSFLDFLRWESAKRPFLTS